MIDIKYHYLSFMTLIIVINSPTMALINYQENVFDNSFFRFKYHNCISSPCFSCPIFLLNPCFSCRLAITHLYNHKVLYNTSIWKEMMNALIYSLIYVQLFVKCLYNEATKIYVLVQTNYLNKYIWTKIWLPNLQKGL